MKERTKMASVRWGLSVYMLSLLALITVFVLGVNISWTLLLKIAGISLLVILFISYPFAFINSGLWKFTHKSIKTLDEREMQITGKSLRIAYAIFSVVVLVILYVFALLEIKVSIVLAAGLLLFAHLLPGAVLVFTEKQLRF